MSDRLGLKMSEKKEEDPTREELRNRWRRGETVKNRGGGGK